jgi:hypothetical protein
MFNKLIKIVILFCLLAKNPCFSQTNQEGFKSDSVVSQYNSYLSAVHLKQLIRAANFSYKKQFAYNGSSGKVNLTNVHVLTIEPDSAFSDDPLKFASTWKSALKTLHGKTDAYWQLFFKLADYAQLLPDSLVIFIKTSRPDIISYMIYFDKGIIENELAVDTRAASELPGDITAESLNNILYGCVFKKVDYSAHLKDSLINKIALFLSTNEQGIVNRSIKIKPVYRADDIIFFEARNLNGRVTKRFFEDITITLTIIPSTAAKSENLASVGYSFNVLFSNRKFTGLADIENSENAIIHHKNEMREYGEALYKLFINTVYAKNN